MEQNTTTKRAGGKRTPILNCKGCWEDRPGHATLIITLRHPAVEDGKPKNYERASEKWPCSPAVLLAERAQFIRDKTAELDRRQAKVETAVAAQAVAATTLRGTLARFLKIAYGVTEREAEDFTPGAIPPRARDQRRHLLHWCEANDAPGQLLPFGQRAYDAITPDDVRCILNRLKTQTSPKVKPWTIVHRRTALNMFYNTINGETGYNPVRSAKVAQPKGIATGRGFDYAYVEQILKHVPDFKHVKRMKADGTIEHGGLSRAKISLRIMCSVGLMCAEQRRIRPCDLNLADGTLFTWRMKNGHLVGERTVQLLPEALAAFQLFHQENMYGRRVPTATVCASAFADAVRKANVEAIVTTGRPLPLPPNVRPTDFRHSFGSFLFRKTGNEKVTGVIMGHAEGSKQTSAYVRSEVSPVVKEATAQVAAHPMFKSPLLAARPK